MTDSDSDSSVKLSLKLTIIPPVEAGVIGLVLSTWFYALKTPPVQSHNVEYAPADDLINDAL